MWLSPTAASAVSGTLFTDKQHGTKPALHQELNFTEREREILKRLVKGYTNQKIAVELGLSVETVKTYIRRIMDKSSIRSRKQLLSVYKKLNNMHSEAKPIAPPGVKPKSV
jgi:DNA-binding NarL/FixJ family response regulator